MTDRIPHLALTILRPHPPEETFSVTLRQNGGNVVHHHPSVSSYRAVHALVDGVRQLFKKNHVPHSAIPDPPQDGGGAHHPHLLLNSVGVELFYLWLEPLWSEIEPLLSLHQQMGLTVVSDAPEVLNIPWELLQWPDGVVLGLDRRFLLRRRPLLSMPPLEEPFTPRLSPPFSVLLASATPLGLESPNPAEARSAEPFAPFLSPLRPDWPFPHTVLQHATYTMVQQHVQSLHPLIVCLAAPVLISGEQGFLAFEEQNGQADIRSAKEMATDLFAGRGVGLVMVVGRVESSSAPPVAAVAALCQGLVRHGVKQALAWPSAGRDPFFSAFLNAFLHNLRNGVPVDSSLRSARHAIYHLPCEQAGCPAWILPVLYA